MALNKKYKSYLENLTRGTNNTYGGVDFSPSTTVKTVDFQLLWMLLEVIGMFFPLHINHSRAAFFVILEGAIYLALVRFYGDKLVNPFPPPNQHLKVA